MVVDAAATVDGGTGECECAEVVIEIEGERRTG